MRKELKILIIGILTISISGCAAVKKRSTEEATALRTGNYNEIIKEVKNYNITEKGFQIRKGKIEIKSKNIEGIFAFNARLNEEGDFTASVRGPLGIEVLRIIAVDNDICAIDRINKTAYTGKNDELLKRSGMPEDFLNILFGDMPDLYYKRTDSIRDRIIIIRQITSNYEREVNICMDEMKVCSERFYSYMSGGKIKIEYGKFREYYNGKYASEINMFDERQMFHVKLVIEDLKAGYDGKIEYVIPEYKKRSL
jgi:hypothetical protein